MRAIHAANRSSIWVSPRAKETDQLLRAATRYVEKHRMQPGLFGSLVMLRPPRPETLPSLRGWFERVVGESSLFRILPLDELLDVLAAPSVEASNIIIGGTIDSANRTLALVRGNLQTFTVPFSLFIPSRLASPNFKRFSVAEYGHVLRFGNYEASVDAVLYQVDAVYRRRIESKRRPA